MYTIFEHKNTTSAIMRSYTLNSAIQQRTRKQHGHIQALQKITNTKFTKSCPLNSNCTTLTRTNTARPTSRHSPDLHPHRHLGATAVSVRCTHARRSECSTPAGTRVVVSLCSRARTAVHWRFPPDSSAKQTQLCDVTGAYSGSLVMPF